MNCLKNGFLIEISIRVFSVIGKDKTTYKYINSFRCSPELAPLSTRTSLKVDDLEDRGANSRQELYLKLSTRCMASKANRLPSDFTWEVRGPRIRHSQCR